MRQSWTHPGLNHKADTCSVTRVGSLVTVSRVFGYVPDEAVTADLRHPPAEGGYQAELRQMLFENLKDILGLAGATLDHVGHVNIFVSAGVGGKKAITPMIDKLWRELFPDRSNQPSRCVDDEVLAHGLNFACTCIADMS
jgi:enamine deaminase RidA (YjgF/YER057c/UK114 family)